MIRESAYRPLLAVLFAILCFAPLANASSTGISGYSGKAGRYCTSCHSSGTGTTATLSGPTSVTSGSTNTYTMTISGSGARGGLDVASSAGTFATAQADTRLLNGELVHSTTSSTKTWTFKWIAPTVTANTSATIYAAGIDCYSCGMGKTTMAVTVTAPPPAPTLTVSPANLSFAYTTGGATPAAQTFSVTSSGTALSYTVATSGGTWLSASGNGTTPGTVSVSVNPAGLAAGT
jgi:hypothetical protein